MKDYGRKGGSPWPPPEIMDFIGTLWYNKKAGC